MNRHPLVATALTLSALPFLLRTVLRRDTLHPQALWLDLDPFDVDLQLYSRNDDAPAPSTASR